MELCRVSEPLWMVNPVCHYENWLTAGGWHGAGGVGVLSSLVRHAGG